MDTVPAIMELKGRTDNDKFTTHCGKGHEGAKEGAVVDNHTWAETKSVRRWHLK